MSASREKKQRLSSGEALTQKELKERKEAEAAKRKTITYWIVGIVVVILVAALLIWDSGLIQRNMTAATIGGENLSVAEMQYYYNSARQSEIQQQQMYSQYGISILSDPYVMYDSSSALGDEQVYNTESGQTYADHFKESALNNARRVIALNQAAKAEGYTLSADGKASVDESIASLKEGVKSSNWSSLGAYLSAAYGSYVSESLYVKQVTASTLANEYATHHQDSLTYDDAALNDYAAENPATVYSYDYRVAYVDGSVPTTDAEGNTVEVTDDQKAAALGAAKTKADVLAEGVKKASDKSGAFDELVTSAVGEDSTYASADNNLKTAVLGSALSQDYTANAYYDWLTSADRKAGDVEVIESTSGYYVVLLTDRYLNDAATVDVRHILAKAELTPADEEAGTPAATEPTQEQMDAAKARAQEALDRYLAGEQTAEAFGALANELSDDTGSNTKGGLYTYVEEGSMVKGFNDWIFDPARQSGDTGLVEQNEAGGNYFGWHVVYFQGVNGPKWHEVAESALKSADMTAWLEGLDEACAITESGSMSLALK
ncbi:peptidylprolyl isomerase [Lawsonibacter faecis]|uniref:Peptidylprolyl isomerase n=1 Tax=Lawsonibacter faecis TaxID=2763052 RepID=A0A8J6JCM1_9FIRM|nr:peptidylprolyl isomerase [Lawsonibacter faecis]MBC5737638.1 peptidylprolyl isomerase [Lawsonibacter faecis]